MTLRSDNGWACLDSDSKLLKVWYVGPTQLTLRAGAAGFILAHLALWFHESLERLDLANQTYDDHGYGARYIGGGSSGVPSNHWSATAIDLNARRHPQNVPTLETFTLNQARRIRTKCAEKYPGVVWGGDWNAVDAMHFEFDDLKRFDKDAVRDLALTLVPTAVGRRLIAAQPKPVNWQKWAA